MLLGNKIYLSGPDCAGKSYMANEFQKFGYTLIKWTIPKKGEDYLKKADQQMAASGKFVLDRGWIGDVIYAPIMGRESVIDAKTAIHLLWKFTQLGNTLIYITANTDVLLKRLRSRGDAHINNLQLLEIYGIYQAFFDNLRKEYIPFYIIDTSHV